jgi:hypothetical protein
MTQDITASAGATDNAEFSIEKALETPVERSPASTPASPTPEDDGDAENGLARVPSEAPYSIFSTTAKAFIIFMVSLSALISPMAATVYYPALNPLAEQLHVSNSAITLSITTYMVRASSKQRFCLPPLTSIDPPSSGSSFRSDTLRYCGQASSLHDLLLHLPSRKHWPCTAN